ncbi:hypothetical protein NW859_04235 [Synechococcus sp. H55.5]
MTQTSSSLRDAFANAAAQPLLQTLFAQRAQALIPPPFGAEI